jgi:putative ABC transport system permease protein
LLVGTLLGLLTGYFATRVISAIITERTSILVQAALGWSEIHLAAVFLGLAMLIGLLPAFSTLRRSVMSELRH